MAEHIKTLEPVQDMELLRNYLVALAAVSALGESTVKVRALEVLTLIGEAIAHPPMMATRE